MFPSINSLFTLGITCVFLQLVLQTARLTGTKNISGDYMTLAFAFTDLNTLGAFTGGVTINIIAGNTLHTASSVAAFAIITSTNVANCIQIH